MRCLIPLLILALLSLAFGAGLIMRANQLPVYTDPDAPGRLERELDKFLTMESAHELGMNGLRNLRHRTSDFSISVVAWSD